MDTDQGNTVATPRAQVEDLEQHILAVPQVDLGTQHVLNGGMYARTILIPAGVVLTGATHKTDHINIVHGDITVTTDAGPVRLTGYHVLPTMAGSKRAGIAHADTMWTTICKTGQTDLAAIEDELVEESHLLQTRQTALTNNTLDALEK